MHYVNENVNLEEISDDDLFKEFDRRGLLPDDYQTSVYKELVEKIYLKRLFGLDFIKETDELIYNVLGRIL
mgnify:CR=1 FL=1